MPAFPVFPNPGIGLASLPDLNQGGHRGEPFRFRQAGLEISAGLLVFLLFFAGRVGVPFRDDEVAFSFAEDHAEINFPTNSASALNAAFDWIHRAH